MGRKAGAAIFGSEPWRECGTRHHFAERPKSTPRYAAISIVNTGATSLTGSHDRLEAESRAAASRSRPQAGGAGRAQREP